jgi:hypothetical protein
LDDLKTEDKNFEQVVQLPLLDLEETSLSSNLEPNPSLMTTREKNQEQRMRRQKKTVLKFIGELSGEFTEDTTANIEILKNRCNEYFVVPPNGSIISQIYNDYIKNL